MARLLDQQLVRLLDAEKNRQQQELSLIASENYASEEVLEIAGTVLTNKYAEGYPGKRYYAGCTIVDQIETLAIQYAKKLFNVDYANVQPHSGSQANMAVYFSFLKPGDTILGMSLAAGGHLTHGHPINISGTYFRSIQYGLDLNNELIDYHAIEQLAQTHKPKLIIAGASAYSRIIDFKKMREIADSIGVPLMVDMAHVAGLVAAGLYPNPTEHAQVVTSTTHKTLRGPRGGLILATENYSQLLDRAIIPGIQGGPMMHIIAAKAQAFYEAMQPAFRLYQMQVIKNAQAMAQTLGNLGYKIVSGGTDTHLFIVDLTEHHITGFDAELVLQKSGISVSRSCVPFDKQKPWITSGIRIGTAALTTRGFQEEQAMHVAYLIDEVIQQHGNATALAHIRGKVMQLCRQFPIYAETRSTFHHGFDLKGQDFLQ